MTNESAHSLLVPPAVQPLAAAADRTVRYDEVRVGEVLPVVSFAVTQADVEAYRDAAGGPGGTTPSTVATLHLLALTLAAITERMPLPATCVHVGQELSWSRTVQADVTIRVRFALISRRTAGGNTLSAFSLHLDAGGAEIAGGRILLQS